MLKGLNPNKACGPDKIPPTLLKNLAGVLAKPLTAIFQSSIDQGCVPEQWKKALVSPIYKKGDRHTAANYRPVSLTSVCCKLCEHVIAKSIMAHLDANNILTDSQHGFRSKRSCETQLLTFVDELLQSLTARGQIDLAILDFSKAFDVVPHARLLYKLEFYGIKGATLRWISSFLHERTQRVVVDDQTSDEAPVTSGVPQGSVLGPILFLVYINDMPEYIKSSCRLFADDSIIYRVIQGLRDCATLQDDLDRLHQWELDWGMSFNLSKCNIMNVSKSPNCKPNKYSLKGVVLETVPNAPYLGVNISSNLSWRHHIKKCSAKANRTLGFVRRNLRGATHTAKTQAYISLVRPQLEYCSTIWSPHQQNLVHDLEMVQHRAARFVKNLYGQQSITAMLRDLSWETLAQRRLKAQVTMTYKIANGLVCIQPNQLIPSSFSTRSQSKGGFRQLATTSNYYKYSFYPTAIRAWNSLPTEVTRADSIDQFRVNLSRLTIDSSKVY